MQVLTEKDYKMLKSLAGLTQKSLQKTLHKFLKDKYAEVICTDKYLMALGNIPIAVVAHMDTVFKTPPSNIYYDMKQGVIWSPEGFGADDRAGVFVIIKIIQTGLRPTIIFTTDEEIGAEGASALIKDYPDAPTPLSYIIQLDRCGTSDCVFYDCDNPDFIKYVENFGFIENFGSFSDISIICPTWKIAGVNLSIGYENEHSVIETLHTAPMLSTIKKVITMLKEKSIPSFEYIPFDYKEFAYNWGRKQKIKCAHCHQEYSEYELFPAFDGLEEHLYCCNCLNSDDVGWCNSCNSAFFITDTNKPYLCKRCNGDIEWTRDMKKSKKNSKK